MHVSGSILVYIYIASVRLETCGDRCISKVPTFLLCRALCRPCALAVPWQLNWPNITLHGSLKQDCAPQEARVKSAKDPRDAHARKYCSTNHKHNSDLRKCIVKATDQSCPWSILNRLLYTDRLIFSSSLG